MNAGDRGKTRRAVGRAVDMWRDPTCTLGFVKGRVALYAILRALGIGPGDDVLVPGFTCVVVPAAVVYTGATARFYDIDPTTLQGDPHQAMARVTPRTRAILVQHNFGSVAPLGDLIRLCQDRGIALVEDCAHALGSVQGEQPVGTFGAASFCSLQWSKPTTTGLGGIARFNDPGLLADARDLVATEFREPARWTSAYLGMLSLLYRAWFRPSWYWPIQASYRWASARGLIKGSSSPTELVDPRMPVGYKQLFGKARHDSLDDALAAVPDLILHRRRIYAEYQKRLAGHGLWLPPPETPETIGGALRFPLLVENRDVVLDRAAESRIELGDWFNAPLHPAGSDPAAFGYEAGSCPMAEAAAARVVNLPTHRHVDENVVDRVLDLLETTAEISPLAWNRANHST